MAQTYRQALVAGLVPAGLTLPGDLLPRQRIVRISDERIVHIAERHPDWALQCLLYMPVVLSDPDYLGYRPLQDRRRVEFVRHVGADRHPLLVAVKFIDPLREAWVSTAHRRAQHDLTRRLRAHTMRGVSRGP